MTDDPAEIARAIFEHLSRPEVRRELAVRQREIDAYFRNLREQMTPTHEQLHRPFTI